MVSIFPDLVGFLLRLSKTNPNHFLYLNKQYNIPLYFESNMIYCLLKHHQTLLLLLLVPVLESSSYVSPIFTQSLSLNNYDIKWHKSHKCELFFFIDLVNSFFCKSFMVSSSSSSKPGMSILFILSIIS